MITQEHPILTAATGWMNDQSIDENAQAAFEDFVTLKYATVVDDIMRYKFGDRETLYDDEAISADEWLYAIKAYLFSRWRYIKQALEYLEAEYNPIENYSGVEHEETEYDVKEHKRTKGEQTNSRLEPIDVTKTVYGQHTDTITPAEKTIDTVTDKQTTTNKVAPFDSSDFSNKEQTITEGQQDGGGTKVHQTVSQQQADSYFYPEKNDTVTSHFGMAEGYEISMTEGERIDTDHPHKDITTRDLQKSGNIGVLTSSAMLTQDDEFWRAFRWLDDLAHDAANILAKSVWAM